MSARGGGEKSHIFALFSPQLFQPPAQKWGLSQSQERPLSSSPSSTSLPSLCPLRSSLSYPLFLPPVGLEDDPKDAAERFALSLRSRCSSALLRGFPKVISSGLSLWVFGSELQFGDGKGGKAL